MNDGISDVIIHPKLKKYCCNDDACRAAIYYKLLQCIAHERKSGKDYWCGSVLDIKTRLLLDCWGNVKVSKEIQGLLSQGLIKKQNNPADGRDRTGFYYIQKDEGKRFKEMCTQHGVCILHHLDFSPTIIALLENLDAINQCCCDAEVHEDHPVNKKINRQIEAAKLKRHIEDAQKRGLEASLSLDVWLSVINVFNCKCAYCEGPYEVLEHFIPVVLGGGTCIKNVIPACYSCNSKKKDYHPLSIPTSFGFNDKIVRVNIYLTNVEVRDEQP